MKGDCSMDEMKKTETGDNTKSVEEIINRVISNIISRKEGVIKGIPTGFAEIDNVLSGLNCGHLIVVAGHPGIGATSLALNICEHLSMDMEIPVLFFSLQDSSERLVERMLLGHSHIDFTKARRGILCNKELEKLKETSREISTKPIYIDDTSRLNLSEIKERAKRIKESKRDKMRYYRLPSGNKSAAQD
jgi:replicative DNA helicase